MTKDEQNYNNLNVNVELVASTTQKTKRSLDVAEVVLEKTLESLEETSMTRWMDIAAPILKSGGKAVAIILALGFVSVPLMLSGCPWVSLVLAIGASLSAIVSCL